MTISHAPFVRLMMCALIGCSFSLSAYAQEVKPEAIPPDPNADSIAAMKDTVHDPRIGKAFAKHNGVWKWVVPPVKMNGTYGDHDPVGLLAGKLIPADCSINWTDPDSKKLYCFATATSLNYFLNFPHTYSVEAQKNYEALTAKPSS